MKEVKLTKEETNAEMMLFAWKSQDILTRKFEIDNAIERLEIDQAIFLIAFMS